VRHGHRQTHAARRLLLGEQGARVKRLAAAAAGGQEPVAHRARAGDERVDLGQLVIGQRAQLGVGGTVSVRVQPRACLQREARLLGEVDPPRRRTVS
jgi:hypothetical protein